MQRVALEAVLRAPGGSVRVIVTHLEFYSLRQRLAQVERLRELQREAVGHAFENAKLNVEQQAAVLRESFAHASELGWFCLPETEEDSRLLVM